MALKADLMYLMYLGNPKLLGWYRLFVLNWLRSSNICSKVQ